MYRSSATYRVRLQTAVVRWPFTTNPTCDFQTQYITQQGGVTTYRTCILPPNRTVDKPYFNGLILTTVVIWHRMERRGQSRCKNWIQRQGRKQSWTFFRDSASPKRHRWSHLVSGGHLNTARINQFIDRSWTSKICFNANIAARNRQVPIPIQPTKQTNKHSKISQMCPNFNSRTTFFSCETSPLCWITTDCIKYHI